MDQSAKREARLAQQRQYSARRYAEDPAYREKRKKQVRDWQDDNPERVAVHRETFAEAHPTYFRDVMRGRRAEPIGTLLNRLRTRVPGLPVIELGCSYEEFLAHMESKFQEDMTWENIADWEIDHVVELWTFADKAKAFHYTNLRPVWPADNKAKHWQQTGVMRC